jgi:hypothetical protein
MAAPNAEDLLKGKKCTGFSNEEEEQVWHALYNSISVMILWYINEYAQTFVQIFALS